MAKKNIKTASKKKKARKFFDNKQYLEALGLYSEVTQIDPRDADAFYMVGVILGIQGRKQQSIEYLQNADALRPDHVLTHYNLGVAYRDSGDLERAREEFEKTVRLKPDYSAAYNSLAHVLINTRRLEEAVDVFYKVIKLQPTVAETRNNLATVLQGLGRMEEAIDCYKKALEINPDMTVAWDSLGSALTSSGQYQAALEAYKQSLQRDPGNSRGHSNMLMTFNYMDGVSRDEVYHEHIGWSRQHADPVKCLSLKTDFSSDRRLRIGYISPDFREHSVAYFVEPLLASHNRDTFEVFCYSSVPQADETTHRLRSLSSHWREIHGHPPLKVAEQIKRDEIDILVELSGHTSGNHLNVLMRKPAPVQLTWLGYPNTTGMDRIDYRIVDWITDPQGSEQYSSEKLIRLPGCFLCYQPPQHAPDIGSSPCSVNDYITFGSFNNLAKFSPNVMALWAQILQRVPNSKLFIKNPSLSDAETRGIYAQRFVDLGIDAERIELRGHTPTPYEHLELYNRVDIGLDTFPYNGTTTTCEALWMGVPVISLCGDRHASRVGATLLTHVGLEQLIADTPQVYVDIAAGLANNPDHLNDWRAQMRDRMSGSALCDSRAFASSMEKVYRELWQKCCRNAAS